MDESVISILLSSAFGVFMGMAAVITVFLMLGRIVQRFDQRRRVRRRLRMR